MKTEYSLKELSSHLSARLVGDGAIKLSGIASLETATSGELSFLSSKSYIGSLSNSCAGAVILREEYLAGYDGPALVLDDPYKAYALASALFDPRPKRIEGIHPSAVVSDSAEVAPSASVGPNCVIGDNVKVGAGCEIYPGVVISENSQLGENCLIYPNVSLYSNVRIGSNVIIHSGTTIGSDGFGFAPSAEGWVKIHQLGGVVIGDNVEIGAGTAIDRGAIGDTVIHDGVIIDNQVHMAHNVEVGENTAIAGCVGIAGSTKIGKNCTFAGAVAVNGHIEIADNCHFNGGTIVTKGTKNAGVFASATPMQDVKNWRKSAVRFGQLDDLAGRIKKLEKEQNSKS
ncbi:MAG: UDP-3-O-(3-hydroxymyristoyl)glucosamine N-acyltransferase [Agarilytica sp.]